MEKVKEPFRRERKSITDDKIKEMLEKFKFKPEFVPSTRQLVSNLSSIHELKIKKLKSRYKTRGAGKY